VGDESYTYDRTGNRQRPGHPASAPTYSINQVLNDGTNTFLYDNEGNTTQKTVIATGRVTQYAWDHRNRLTQVQERVSAAGAVLETVQYSYDAFDRRTIKRLDNDGNGTFERYWAYLNDGSHTILELEDSDGQEAAQPFRVSNRFLHGDAVDMVLADEQYSGGQGFQLGSTTANATQGTTLWTLGDNLGSIRDVVDNGGIVRQHVLYNAFGVRLSEIDRDATGAVIDSSSPTAIDTLFGYTGRDWDSDTDLQYNRARWYDPAQGRWLSQDPIGFAAGDVNLYRYVGNHPTYSTDPSGLQEPINSPTLEEMERIRQQLRSNRAMGGIALSAHGNGWPAGSFAVTIDPNNRTVPGSEIMRELGIRMNRYVWGFPVETGDYWTLKQGCVGLNKLRLNTEKEVFALPGTRAFSSLEAALEAQWKMIESNNRSTRIVISAYQDNYLDAQLAPFLLDGSGTEYDMNQPLRGGPPNTDKKGNLAVFDFITVHQNKDRSVCFYETMDFGHRENPNLNVQRKTKLYPPERAGTIYLVTPILDHPRAPRSPFGTK
jgi:RHS repeat-associated protein